MNRKQQGQERPRASIIAAGAALVHAQNGGGGPFRQYQFIQTGAQISVILATNRRRGVAAGRLTLRQSLLYYIIDYCGSAVAGHAGNTKVRSIRGLL